MKIEFKEITKEVMTKLRLDGHTNICDICVHQSNGLCINNPCSSEDRIDKKNVYFVEVKN